MDGVLKGLILLIVFSFTVEASELKIKEKYDKLVSMTENVEVLSEEKIDKIFSATATSKVTSLKALKTYDPTGMIGFCFGRAMSSHLIARKMGLAEKSISKIFVVGDLRTGNMPQWRFHVATVIRSKKNKMLALDTVLGGVVPVRTWIRVIKNLWDKNSKAYFYQTSASAVLPDLRHSANVDNETGEYLIELSFNPANRKGFRHNPQLDPRAYDLDLSAELEFFQNVDETEKERFNFMGIAILGTYFSYNNYFKDLMTEMSALKTSRIRYRPPMFSLAEFFVMVRPFELYSPRLGELLR